MLDTNVLVSGLLWKGAPHRCLQAAEGGLYTLVLAEPILQELRDKLVAKFKNTAEEADESLAGLRRVATLVALTGQRGWVVADTDDDKFVEAAVIGKADAIVSGDHHLLDLQVVEGIPVLSPRQFLDHLSGQTSV